MTWNILSNLLLISYQISYIAHQTLPHLVNKALYKGEPKINNKLALTKYTTHFIVTKRTVSMIRVTSNFTCLV